MCRKTAQVLLFFIICLYSWTALAAPATFAVRAVALTWTESPRTTQTITWQTDPGPAAAWVEFSEADTPDMSISNVRREQAFVRVLRTDLRDNAVCSATLRGLKPGTRYVYRLGDGTQWFYDGTFRTENSEEAFQFLLFGDSQSTDYRVWQDTFQGAVRMGRGVRFFVNVGDLVDNGQKQSEWDGWFAAVKRNSGRLPIVPVVGNHETYTPERTFSLPRYFMAQLPVPQNGPEKMKGQAYSFDYQRVHFVVLDTQFGEERAFLPDSLERQKAWLERDLASARQPWKIVLMHRPIYHNRKNENRPDAAAAFAPIFDAYGVDIVFSGHDHVLARTPKLKAGAPAQGGTIYATVGRSGTKTYDAMERKPWNETFFNPEQPVYSVVSVEQNVVYVRSFQQDGVLIDEWTVMKSALDF